MFVLDTNTLIYFFRGEGEIARRMLAEPVSSIAVPTPVVYELETGIAKSAQSARRRSQFDALLAVVTVLPFDVDEARSSARIRAKLEAAGTPIGPIDNLIAGTALAHGATLVTRNTQEFGRVEGLRIENWYDGG